MDARHASDGCDWVVFIQDSPTNHTYVLSEDDTVELYDISFHSN